MVSTNFLSLLIASAVFSLVSSTSQIPLFKNLRSPRPITAQSSPERTKTCIVNSNNDFLTDDSTLILEAVNDCNRGGHVIFLPKTTYLIGKPLNLTHLENIDIDIQGTISFTTNTTFWQKAAFSLGYQNAITFLLFGGKDVHLYGGGTIEGNGQTWWDLYGQKKSTLRPVLFTTLGLHHGSISNIKMRNSPMWANLIANSSDVTFTDIAIWSVSNNQYFEKNTDGWDIYRSHSITIQNSTVTNGDDCVSLKPNSTSILLQNLHCNGTHGISVGSLGQYADRLDFVEDVLVRNISMYNSSEGARIKVWPDSYSEKSAALTGGGGGGLVRNVTYDGMWLDNVDYGLTVTQCYGQDNETACFEHPSKLKIRDITFRNIRGRSNRVFAPLVGHLVCSGPDTCSNIVAENVDIRSINGSNLVTCRNIDQTNLDLNCTDWSKGYNPA